MTCTINSQRGMQIAISPSLPHLPLYSDLPCGRVTTLAFHTTLDGSSPTFASPSLLPFPSSALHCLCAGAPSATKQHCGPSFPAPFPKRWCMGWRQRVFTSRTGTGAGKEKGRKERGRLLTICATSDINTKWMVYGRLAGLDSSVGNYRKPVKFTVFSVAVFWYISV